MVTIFRCSGALPVATPGPCENWLYCASALPPRALVYVLGIALMVLVFLIGLQNDLAGILSPPAR